MENSERDGIPDHLPCLLRNLYADQEAAVRTGHETTDRFQIRLQQYMNLELPLAEEPEIRLLTSAGSSQKQESSRKNIYFCFIDCDKAFGCLDHNNLWKILKEMEYQTT